MWYPPENDAFVEELYLAGERVPSGTYKQLGSSRVIRVEEEDALPASLDGRVACYVRVQHTWAQMNQYWITEDLPPFSQLSLSASPIISLSQVKEKHPFEGQPSADLFAG
jgi:hypothetical protein